MLLPNGPCVDTVRLHLTINSSAERIPQRWRADRSPGTAMAGLIPQAEPMSRYTSPMEVALIR
jgi:hypothetical protein